MARELARQTGLVRDPPVLDHSYRGGTVGPMVSHGYLVLDAYGLQVFSVPRG